MPYSCRLLVVTAGLSLAMAGPALAQSTASTTAGDWKVTVYPVLAWVPTSISIDVNVKVPPVGGGGGEVVEGGKIIDGRFDGAFFGGFAVSKGPFRLDADFLWAAVGGDRPERPLLTVDVDVIYAHATGGLRLYKDLYVTAGVRRLALKYDVKIGDLARFEQKPGVWDPVVGLALHKVGEKFELHGLVEGGGFGVGTDSEFAGSLRVDWKPARHFGLTAGYSFLSFKVSEERANRTLEAKQTLHGPTAGIGLYF